MKHVLYVSHTAELGGGEYSLLLLLERLDRDRFRPHVALPGPGPLTSRLEERDVAWSPAPLLRFERTANPIRLGRYVLAWRRAARVLSRLAEQVGADLVHANSTTAHLFAAAEPARSGVPSIWHVRDFSLTGISPVDRALVRRAAAIIAISGPIRDGVPAVAGAADKTVVIHNGVDINRFRSGDGTAVRRELGLDAATPLAGIVGQVVPWKGHARFLDAAARAAEPLPRARFLVVGDNRFGDFPGLLDELEARSRELGLGDRVAFTGWRDDVVEVMNALDVLVLASENEPFGRVVIEAMACGTPIVSFRCGGPVEIIEHGRTGLLVEPFDTDAMAKAMTELLSDPARAAEMGRAGREVVEQRFSADAYARKVQDVYERLSA
jgi:glycosyltransferase involved in cell wall biosynthesis